MATCKDCIHYIACKRMLEAMGHAVDGDGIDADKRCRDFEREKRGTWKKDRRIGKDYKCCTICNYEFARLHPDNFCPNCGSRMVNADG